MKGIAEEVQGLLKRNPELASEKDQYGWMPIHLAAKNGHANVIEAILASGFEIDTMDEDGCTALFWAVNRMDAALIAFLLAKGANVLEKGSAGPVSLIVELRARREEAVEEVLEGPAGLIALLHAKGLEALSKEYEDLARSHRIGSRG